MSERPAMKTADPVTASPDEIIERQRALLCRASLAISSFRWRLKDAGCPFREPPAMDALIEDIDREVFPDIKAPRILKGKGAPRSPAAVAAGEALAALRP